MRGWVGSQDPLSHTPSGLQEVGPPSPFSRMSSAPSSHWSSSSYSSSTSETEMPSGQQRSQGKGDLIAPAPSRYLLQAVGIMDPQLPDQDTEAQTGKVPAQGLRGSFKPQGQSHVWIHLILKVIPSSHHPQIHFKNKIQISKQKSSLLTIKGRLVHSFVFFLRQDSWFVGFIIILLHF